MINSVRLVDFQSHKDTKIDLHPVFTIICGSSGNGKSAIMRAVKYATFGNPGTSEVRLPDAKEYRIELNVNEQKITRIKGTGINAYYLNDKTAFVDVNRDVPQSIQNVLNIKEINLDTSVSINLHFSDQLDAPFMLKEKDSVKMKFLNVLSGTNAVDLAAKRAIALSKENTRQEKQLKQDISDIQNELEAVNSKLAILKKASLYIKNKKSELDELISMRAPLYAVKESSDYLHSEYKKLKILTENLKNINIEQVEHAISRYTQLVELEQQYKRTKDDIRKVKAFETQYVSLNIQGILEKIDRFIQLTNTKESADALKAQYFALNSVSKALNSDFDTAIAAYIEKLNTCQICPVCGNSITQDCIKEIANSFQNK